MTPPAIIHELVARFRANLDSYKRGIYNETQVRREFIDPFFEALGWDVANRQGYAEAYKDVVHEDAIKVGGGTKAPDYGFRIGGVRKFFVEAKKPSVDIKGDVHPAYQLRRYAWSARLPLSILTDFEEFAVYDCRIKPDKTDKPSTARVIYVTFEQYAARWEEIAGIFMREAILKGSFDRYAEAKGGKRGTAEVDAAFLAEIERWRDLLAHNIALRNATLGARELNFAVQQTIDRLIFLRIGEDRGIEPYGQLLGLVNGGQVYARLLAQFRRADERYNSGLFHFRVEKDRLDTPDTLTPGLAIDDKVLRDILKNLYYPDSPYEFSVLPADILGQVYEQFLGKVIRLTSGHRAVVEEKPEVRKAGGVYYTPTYIVDYIVNQTVGKLVEGKRPGPLGGVSKLRILDPACGSGSFLLGAYQFLLDWHRAQYIADGPEKWAGGRTPRLHQGRGGEWQLTIDERKRILLNNLHGVDIDPQAVEVTKLSLLLKVLEGADEQTMGRQLALFHERALPDLGRNIQCGNSLVGPDFYAGRQMALLSDDEARRINVFDWMAAFPQVMADGGFDAVIGNPPYGAELLSLERDYLESKYQLGTTDSAALMIAQALALTKNGGVNSFIVPKPLTFSSNWRKVRARLLDGLQQLVDTGKVWKNVKLEQIIYTCRREIPSKTYESCVRKDQVIHCLGEVSKEECNRFGFFLNGVSDQEVRIAKRVQNAGIPLGDLVTNTRGGMFQNLVNQEIGGKSVVGGAQLGRYRIADRKGYIDVTPQLPANSFVRPDSLLVQNIVAHIDNPTPHIKIIGTIVEESMLQKIVILDTVNQLQNRSSMAARYLLGLLLSHLLNWYVYRFVFAKAIRTMHFDGPVTSRIPIRTIDFASPADVARHDRMVDLVTRMLDLHKKLALEQVPHAKTVLQRQIEATDRQIDALVYELYGLTDAEVAIVEGG